MWGEKPSQKTRIITKTKHFFLSISLAFITVYITVSMQFIFYVAGSLLLCTLYYLITYQSYNRLMKTSNANLFFLCFSFYSLCVAGRCFAYISPVCFTFAGSMSFLTVLTVQYAACTSHVYFQKNINTLCKESTYVQHTKDKQFFRSTVQYIGVNSY
jgi:hypothetical protein